MKIVSENDYRITYEVNSSLHVTLFKETKEVLLSDDSGEEFLLADLEEVKKLVNIFNKILMGDQAGPF